MKANKFLFLVLLILMSSPNVAHAQFWQGFLYGVGQAAQNYNNQRQNSNRRSSDYYANKYGNGSSNSRTTEPEVTKTRKVEDDGFVWYRLRRSGGTYGIENANGDVVLYPDYGSINYDKESKNFDVKCESGCHEGVLSKSGSWIIPLDREYESLYYSDLFDRYVVEKNGFKGICSTDGKEIIAPSKYSSIHLYEGIYYVEKDGYEGACDANGKEIIAPNSYEDILFLSGEFKYKNDDGDWISMNIDKYGNRIDNEGSSYARTSSTSSTSSSSTTTSSSTDIIIKNISDKFFTTDATHNIKLFYLSPGLKYNYEKGESTLTIKNSTMILKYGDGSGSTNKLSRAIIKVFGDGSTVEEVAYFDEDRKNAYIAKMSQYGVIIVYSYVYNHNVKSYVNVHFYGLY